MWIIAAVFTLLLLAGGLYETWAIKFHKLTITQLTKRRTHLMILVYLAVFTIFGYVLGVGGR
jgi:hypothetical protein